MAEKALVRSAFPGLTLLVSVALRLCLIVFIGHLCWLKWVAEPWTRQISGPFEASFSASIEQGIPER